jgi:hypothetical protein
MQTTLRTLLAAIALAISAFVITLATPADDLAVRGLLPMFVAFAVAWMIAVGERATVPRGGLRVPRFPLGARLLQVRPGLGAQYIALIGVLGLVCGPKAALWGAVITAIITVNAVRRVSWFIIPGIWLVNTLATMKEFHTLGDLVADASGWLKAVVILGVEGLIVCGPLLRTDVGGKLRLSARIAGFLAALPAWGAAFWIFSHTILGGHELDGEALAATLLAGCLLQSLLLAGLNWMIKLEDRTPEGLPQVQAHGVGLALMPLLLPIVACALLVFLPLPDSVSFGGSAKAWAGLMVVLCIIPAVPAAGLVGAALDRVDGRGRGFTATVSCGAALAGWFLIGPLILEHLYAPGGLAASLHKAFDSHAGGAVLSSTVIPGSSPLSGHHGGQLALFGLPAADLCRAVTLMFLGLGALCARYLRHARLGQNPAGWEGHLLLLALAGGGTWLLVPRLGAVAAPLACAAGAAVLLGLDLFHAELRVKTAEELLAAEIAREDAELARRRAERAAMAGATPTEIVS